MVKGKALLTILLMAVTALSVGQADARPAEPGKEWVRSNPFTTSAAAMSDTYWDVNIYKDCNFNTVHPWQRLPTHPHGNTVILNSARSSGLMVHPDIRGTHLHSGLINFINTISDPTSNVVWYVMDEPPDTMFPGITDVVNWLKTNRPNALIYLGTADTTDPYLESMVTQIQPDALSVCGYIFLEGASRLDWWWSGTSRIRNKTLAHGIPYFRWIQAFSGVAPDRHYRLPTEAEVRFQIYTSLAAGAKGLFYWIYDCDAWDDTNQAITHQGAPTPLYYQVQGVNVEVNNLGRVMRYLNSTDVRYVRGWRYSWLRNSVPDGLTNWSYGAGGNTLITNVDVDSDQHGLEKDGFIGFFNDDTGKQYFMLTNVFRNGSLNFTVTFDSSVNQILKLNRLTGAEEVVNLNNNELKLNLAAGNGELFKMDLDSFDLQAPTGWISINGGAWGTESRDVTLTLSGTDDKGVTHMRFSNDRVQWTDWESYATVKPWTLSPEYGTKTVSVQFKDAVGTISAVRSASIVYASDVTPPSVPTNVQGSAVSASSVQLTWDASTDNVGVTGYRIFRSGTLVGTSDTTSYLDTGLQPETTYSYAVSAYDAAGNHSGLSSPPAVVTTPADTEPPSVPGNVTATALSMTSVRVNWSASTDNVGVAGYRLYRDGGQIGSTIYTSYVDSNLEPGGTYSYTVTAYDGSGNESAHSLPAVVTTPSVPEFCSVDMGSTDINYYLSRVAVLSDGRTSAVTVGGLNCRRPLNTDHHYYYFNIDDGYIYDGSVSTVYLEVSYFNDLTAPAFIEPQYDSSGGIYTSLPQVMLSGSNEWKIATWTLTDCKFANRQEGGADFRLYVGTNDVKIDTVRISKIPYLEHESVERKLGVNEAYWGLTHPQYAVDGNTGLANKGGVVCRRAIHPSRYFYFNVSDAVIYDGSSSRVYLKVEYYDAPGGFITPEYDSMSDEYTAAETLTFSGTDTWKEHIWTLEDVKFANRQNAGCDFRLDVGNDVEAGIGRVTISKVAFPDNEPPSVPGDVVAEALTPTMIKVSWSASTDNIGVEGYKIYRNGIEVGESPNTEYADAGLEPGTTYSYTVSAYDAWGNESAQSSPAAVATTMSAIGIAGAKELPDAATVGLVSQVVTAVFDGYLYVGEIDRHTGIRVVPVEMPEGIEIGDLVDVGGTLQTVDGERRIEDAVVSLNGSL